MAENGEQYHEETKGDGLSNEYRQYISDLRAIADSPIGKRFLVHVLESLGTFEPAWHPKNAQMAKAIVLSDFGQEILDDLAMASAEALAAIQQTIRISKTDGYVDRVFSTKEEK